MKLKEYKEMLLNQDLNELDKEILSYARIEEFNKNNENYSHNCSEEKFVENKITIEGLGEFYYGCKKMVYFHSWGSSTTILFRNGEQKTRYFEHLLYNNYCKLLCSFDENVKYGCGLNSKEWYIERINKKWDRYFIDLEKSLENICGNPLDEIFLNNYSDYDNRSNATVFGGPKGKAIIWTTISGGYNIQQRHIRLFCKKLTEQHIKDFSIIFSN